VIVAVALAAGAATITAVVAAVMGHRRHDRELRSSALLTMAVAGYLTLISALAELTPAVRVAAAMSPTPARYLVPAVTILGCLIVTVLLAVQLRGRR